MLKPLAGIYPGHWRPPSDFVTGFDIRMIHVPDDLRPMVKRIIQEKLDELQLQLLLIDPTTTIRSSASSRDDLE